MLGPQAKSLARLAGVILEKIRVYSVAWMSPVKAEYTNWYEYQVKVDVVVVEARTVVVVIVVESF